VIALIDFSQGRISHPSDLQRQITRATISRKLRAAWKFSNISFFEEEDEQHTADAVDPQIPLAGLTRD